MHVCAKFGPDRTTGGYVYTLGNIHTRTHTHMHAHAHARAHTYTHSYIDVALRMCCLCSLPENCVFVTLQVMSAQRKWTVGPSPETEITSPMVPWTRVGEKFRNNITRQQLQLPVFQRSPPPSAFDVLYLRCQWRRMRIEYQTSDV